MQFVTKHCRIRRLADCWAVATRKGEGAKEEWNDDKWFYATLQAASHKALELEMRNDEGERDLRDAVSEIDAAYDRIYRELDKVRIKEA